jgi:YggT family protein
MDITFLLARLISFAINVYIFIIIIRAVISWVNPDPYNPIVRALYRFTEPVLHPIRRMLFRSMGNIGIDFSPFVVIILLYIFRAILLRLIY